MHLSGPYGRFVLHTGDDQHAIFVAGGTGLAPIKAMIRHGLENDAYEGDLTLYQGGRSREWLYDVDFFRSLAAEFPQFTYRPCLSDETAEQVAESGEDPTAFGFGMVTDVIAADHASLSGCKCYSCGPPPMVEAALKTLMSRRLFPRDIHREEFFNEGDKAGGVNSPSSNADLIFPRQRREVMVRPPSLPGRTITFPNAAPPAAVAAGFPTLSHIDMVGACQYAQRAPPVCSPALLHPSRPTCSWWPGCGATFRPDRSLHWNAEGIVDGTMSRPAGALLPAAIMLVLEPPPRRPRPGHSPQRPRRALGDRVPRGTDLAAGHHLWRLAGFPARRRGHQTTQFSPWWFLPAALVGAAVTWLVARGIPTPPAPARTGRVPASAPRLNVADDQQVWWSGYAAGGLSVRSALGGLLVAALVVAVVGPWLVALIPILVAVLVAGLTAFRVVVGREQVVATGSFGWPRIGIPLGTVTQAEVGEVNPLAWGGWGLRYRPGGVAIVTRKGPGLTLERTDGSTVVLSVTDAATAAATINTLVERAAS